MYHTQGGIWPVIPTLGRHMARYTHPREARRLLYTRGARRLLYIREAIYPGIHPWVHHQPPYGAGSLHVTDPLVHGPEERPWAQTCQ